MLHLKGLGFRGRGEVDIRNRIEVANRCSGDELLNILGHLGGELCIYCECSAQASLFCFSACYLRERVPFSCSPHAAPSTSHHQSRHLFQAVQRTRPGRDSTRLPSVRQRRLPTHVSPVATFCASSRERERYSRTTCKTSWGLALLAGWPCRRYAISSLGPRLRRARYALSRDHWSKHNSFA